MPKSSFLRIPATNYGEVLEHKYDIAILPWGAVEPHNYHLPYLTDCILSYEIACDCAEEAYKKGLTCMVMPPVYLGSQNTGQWNKPFCVHTRSETQKAVLQDIVTSLHIQGFKDLVIINGHGGNTFKPYVRDLAMQYPEIRIVVVDWYSVVPTSGYFEEKPDDHAGEQETSVMLHYHPELVSMERAGDGAVRPGRIAAVNSKTGWMPRHWDEISSDTGIGNPKKSTAEKGERYVKAVTEKITGLLIELKNTQ
ncbi:MAG: creatininase family protein [Proteiniphilum sp.]|nr:creatininase family protein [Proteiniphilum sp.]MDD3909279.1 creatininase family protein [Proteiniphilum sp.]